MDTRTAKPVIGFLPRTLSAHPVARALAYLSPYALTVALASLMWQHPVRLTLTYVVVSAVLLWRWHAFSEVLYFALPAVLGPIGEYVAISFGAWEYTKPLVNIPLWLPLAWGISGLSLKKLADLIIEVRPIESH